jgi:flagellar biosynthetic protein FliP
VQFRRRWLLLAAVAVAFVATGIGPARAASSLGQVDSGAADVPTITVPQIDTPTVPTPTNPADGNSTSGVSLNLNNKNGSSAASQPLTIVLLLTLVSIVPALLILMTSFTRIVIVLGLTRNALNLQGVPPNQVLIGLALFLTLFVMGPVFSKVNADAIQPYMKGEITQSVAFEKGMEPMRGFMLKQTRQKDIAMFVKLSGEKRPAKPKDLSNTTLIPAFVISELRAAFIIGFVIFIPFLVIDMVVSASLMSMGMVMLPPVLISLPFKLLLFVVMDGWLLVVQSLVKSFVR